LRKLGRFAAAELKRERMLLDAEVEMARLVAMQQRTGRHHLGVKPGAAGQQAMEIAAVPVGPVHHRRDREAPRAELFVIQDDVSKLATEHTRRRRHRANRGVGGVRPAFSQFSAAKAR
jgi:hypothetical protein